MDRTLDQDKGIISALTLAARNDYKAVCKGVIKEDLPEMGKAAARPFIAAGKYSTNFIKISREEGPKQALHCIGTDAKQTASELKKLPSRIKNTSVSTWKNSRALNSHFKSLSPEGRAVFALKATAYIISTGLGAYAGAKAGNAIPDKDISWLGIGKHRSALTHSIIPTIGIGLVSRFLIRYFEAAQSYLDPQTAEHQSIGFLITNLKCIAFGGAVGVSYHLGLDGTLEGHKAVTTPFSNTFVRGTLMDDNAFLVANSLGSALIGEELLKKKA